MDSTVATSSGLEAVDEFKWKPFLYIFGLRKNTESAKLNKFKIVMWNNHQQQREHKNR